MVSELKKRPRPRSPSFTMPVAVMNTLAGLMSTGQGHGIGVGRAGLEGMGGGRRPGSDHEGPFSEGQTLPQGKANSYQDIEAPRRVPFSERLPVTLLTLLATHYGTWGQLLPKASLTSSET